MYHRPLKSKTEGRRAREFELGPIGLPFINLCEIIHLFKNLAITFRVQLDTLSKKKNGTNTRNLISTSVFIAMVSKCYILLFKRQIVATHLKLLSLKRYNIEILSIVRPSIGNSFYVYTHYNFPFWPK